MSPVAAVIAIAATAAIIISVLGLVQAERTRRATREGLDRASGQATEEQLLGLVTHAPEDRMRQRAATVDADELDEQVTRMRETG